MIHAIQQLGLGVVAKQAVLDWFARVLEFRTVVFDDQGDATFMMRYTGGELCRRDAALVLNSHGGSGLEIWQHISRKPIPQPRTLSLCSIGLLICKIRCKGIAQVVERLREDPEPSLFLIGEIAERPTGEKTCYFSVFGTWFQLIEGKRFFSPGKAESFCAGVAGVTIGVSELEQSLEFYRNVLGYNHVIQDKEGEEWQDWLGFAELGKLGKQNSGGFRRVVLQRGESETGLYGSLFGTGEIELIEAINSPLGDLQQSVKESLGLGKGAHIYAGRYWGDPGLIHLCFDVNEMATLRTACVDQGLEFTVDTGEGFAMGNSASGRFAYLEDPDGSLIEFVETYRIPISKKLGLSLNVEKRRKPLPYWALKFATKDNYQGDSPKQL